MIHKIFFVLLTCEELIRAAAKENLHFGVYIKFMLVENFQCVNDVWRADDYDTENFNYHFTKGALWKYLISHVVTVMAFS